MKKSIFIFIDAMGWELMKKHDFLKKEMPIRNASKMQFGYSSTAIPTILTGKKPSEHGQFSYYYHDKNNSPFNNIWFKMLRLLPSSITERGRVRSYISKLAKFFFGYTGYFQIYSMPLDRITHFNYSEKKDLFQPGAFKEVDSIFDYLKEKGINYFRTDWRKNEVDAFQNFKETLTKPHQFYFLYFAELDGVQHKETKEGASVPGRLELYKERIQEIMQTLDEQGDEYRISVVSDHGMTTLTSEFDLKEVIDRTGLEFGRDYISCFDSTMLRLWFLNLDAKKVIIKALGDVKEGSILSEEELERFGIDFEGQKYGELFFLMKPGVQIVPSDMCKISFPGMHGYTPDHKDSDASFLANFEPRKKPEWVGDFFNVMKEMADWSKT